MLVGARVGSRLRHRGGSRWFTQRARQTEAVQALLRLIEGRVEQASLLYRQWRYWFLPYLQAGLAQSARVHVDDAREGQNHETGGDGGQDDCRKGS